MEGVDQKTLYVGLSRSQALAIQEGKPVFPEESSSRFGWRGSPMAALERTNRFWAWHVSHHDPEEHPVPQPLDPKDFILGTIRLSSWGFLLKVNGGILTKTAPTGEWRWHGGLQREERLPDGRVVYSIDTLQEVV